MKKSVNARPSTGTEMLFSMVLFLVFSLCTVFTILIGGRVYENIRARDDRTFHRDTALAYITNKVRQADQAGAVSIREDGGVPVLILTQELGGSLYETWIYTKDGELRELFTGKDSGLGTADGLGIMECRPLAFSLEETSAGASLLTVTLDGDSSTRILLRSGPLEIRPLGSGREGGGGL